MELLSIVKTSMERSTKRLLIWENLKPSSHPAYHFLIRQIEVARIQLFQLPGMELIATQ